jgi:transposase
VFCGIDSHKDTLAACLVDHPGRRLAAASFPNTLVGHRQLAAWLDRHAAATRVGIEGGANLGAALARFLADHGVDVREVPGALTVRERRRLRRPGKSDPTDALAIARICARDTDLPRSARPAWPRISRCSATTATSCWRCVMPKATGCTPTLPSSAPATARSAGG